MALDDSTIQQDVPSDTVPETDTPPPSDTTAAATPAPEPVKSERELALEAIEARHHAQVARDNGLQLDQIASVDDQLAAQLPQDDPDPSPAPAPQPADPQPQATARQTVRVKVDGIESEVPLDEVVRNFQKGASADRKLAEAARMQREAAELQAQLLAQHQQLQAQLQQQPAAAPAAATNSPAPAPAVEEEGKAFLKALFEGDEETALQKLAELTKGRNAPPPVVPAIPDVNQLAEQVTAHVQQKLQVDSALAQHRKDYPEIYADPDMEGFVLTKVNGVRRETGEDFFTALNKVSNEFAQKFGWSAASQGRPQPAAAPTTTNTRAVKLERKASIDNVSSVNTKTGSTEAVPETPSDVIAAMRAQRMRS